MGLLRRIPTHRNNQHTFLLEVGFEAYAAHLSALSLTEHKPAPAEDTGVEDGLGRLPHRLVAIQDKLNELRTILSSFDVSSAAIYGEKGIGKSSVVEAFLRARAEKKLSSKTLAKPVFIFDGNKFFIDIARENWVKEFDESLQSIAERGGIVVFDNFDDFIKMADGEAGRLVNCLISHLERGDGLQAIYCAQSDKRAQIEETSSGIARQFKAINITKEPGLDELKPMLIAHIPVLEQYYNVNFTEEAVDEIIRLLSRYPGRAFVMPRPSNAIAFADKVGAYVKINKYAEPLANAAMEERLGLIRDELILLDGDEAKKANERRNVLKTEQKELQGKYTEAKAAYTAKFAALLQKQQKLSDMDIQLSELRGKTDRTQSDEAKLDALADGHKVAKEELDRLEKSLYAKPPAVRASDVRAVFNSEAGIAIKSEAERIKRLDDLEPYLEDQIYGQSGARTALADTYSSRELSVSDPQRPAGVLVFAGGTGLGKTELVKALMRFHLGVEKRPDLADSVEPIIVNMNNFATAASVSSLTGSSRGLVGYGDVIPWLEEVKKNPYAVLLLDEADKAHPNIFDALMQVLDTGKLTISTGEDISFKDVIIVIAMNGITDKDLTEEERTNEDALRRRILEVRSASEEARGQPLFKEPFLARVGFVSVFDSLTDEQLIRIFRQQEMRKINRDYKDNKVSVSVDDATIKGILDEFNAKANGGRGPRNVAAKYIRPLLTRHVKARKRQALIDGNFEDMPDQRLMLTYDPTLKTIGLTPVLDEPFPPETKTGASITLPAARAA